MEFFAVRFAILVLMLPHDVSGKMSGAPGPACVDLTPQHNTSVAQTTTSPYTIIFSPATFTASGSPITVTLSKSSGTTFKGFLLTTQYEDSCVDQSLMPGTFTPIANSHMACTNGAVTHSNINTQDSLSFQWTPPATSEGNIRFRATFVQQFDTFWVNVKAGAVLVDSAVGAGQSKCNASSATQPPSPIGTLTKDPACGQTKGCYSDCSGTDCNFLMTWAEGTSTDNILITMSSKIGNEQNRYIAFGLSKDNEMGDDSVNYCINDATGVFSSYNDGKINVHLSDPKEGLGGITVTFQNGVLTCTFTRTKATGAGANSKLFALDKAYTIFWAEGPGSAAGAGRHSSLPLMSTSAVSLQDFTVDIGGGADFLLVKAHGSIMMVAWVFFASIGIVMARYFKNVWEDNKWFGQKIWFQIHRTCMVLCFLFTVTAFIIIFVEAEGYSDIEGEGYKIAHPIIGIIVTALTVINPIMALFRPHPGTKNRPIFNWLHWAVGFGAYIMAVIAVFFGMKLDKADSPDYIIYILVAFVVWQAFIQILLELTQCRGCNSVVQGLQRSLGGSDQYEMTDVNKGPSEDQSSPQQSSSIKPVLLVVHVLVITAFTITLIVVLNVGHDQ